MLCKRTLPYRDLAALADLDLQEKHTTPAVCANVAVSSCMPWIIKANFSPASWLPRKGPRPGRLLTISLCATLIY